MDHYLLIVADIMSLLEAKPLEKSLPPLIPSIPRVTELLASLISPLPSIQIRNPPLDSPPFTPSDIKPI